MILYFDASAVVKLLLVERGSNEARRLWNADAPVLTSWITLAEVSAAIGRARRAQRISARRAFTALRSLEAEWPSVHPIDAEEVTGRYAGQLANRHGLRGTDAVHLASALLVGVARPVMVTWDKDLRRAASAEGLAVAV